MRAEYDHLSWIKKRGVLLLLFVAFLFTSSLVFEQSRIIESQRLLIRDLFHDSMELNQIKIQQVTSHSPRSAARR